MEFRFDVRPLFATPLQRIDHTLTPQGFRGDRRQLMYVYIPTHGEQRAEPINSDEHDFAACGGQTQRDANNAQ